MKKNIFILVENITKIAGTERAVSNLANLLISDNCNITIISIDSISGNCSYLLDNRVKIVHLNLDIINKNVFTKVKSYIRLINFLKRYIYETSSCIGIGTYSIFNCIISLMPGIKKIGCEHFNYESAGKFQKILRRIFYQRLDSLVVLTNKDKKNYNFINNVVVIPNSKSFETKQISLLDSKEIISVGRLTKQKGFDILLDVIEKVSRRYPDWHFSILGEGEERDILCKKIDDLAINNYVTLYSNTTDVKAKYLKSSIYVSTSRWEGFSLVLLEAQICGLPAVTFDCPSGPSDIVIDNETGFVVPMNEIDIMVDRIVNLIEDEEKRRVFGRNAHIQSERFSSEKISKMWNDLIDSILD